MDRALRRDFLMSSEIAKKYEAELIGTFWLTLGGCGTAVIAASFPQTGVGLLGVAFAFGLTVLTMAYAHRAHLRVPSRRHVLGRTPLRSVSAHGSAGLADGCSGHADTIDPGPPHAATNSDLRDHAVQLRD